MAINLVLCLQVSAQFSSIVKTNALPITSNTQDKTQSKVFAHSGKFWAVLPNSSGTHLWRIDNNTWTHILRLSTKTGSRADCKVVGNIVHVFMFQGTNSQLVSLEYVPELSTFKLWSQRPAIVSIGLDSGVETAMIDVDGTGRMWLASDGSSTVNVRWSDPPYSQWSSPITLASGITSNDKCAIIAMPGKLGVFWSNQNTRLFGFKTHLDGTSPISWTNDESPASQSAVNVGGGMADDHFNMTTDNNGNLYCAIKTSYNKSGYPLIGLLVRRPNGIWDDLYEVSTTGTTPTVILNEAQGKVKVLYTSQTYGKDIVYKESLTSNISFGNQHILLSGTSYRDQSSTKQNYSNETFILASSTVDGIAIGVTATDGGTSTPTTPPQAPTLNSPINGATNVLINSVLEWSNADRAESYQVQVATSPDFSSTLINQSGVQTTTLSLDGLAYSTNYYWRVRSVNTGGNSAWSTSWSFMTEAPPLSVPSSPTLVSPTDNANGISTSPKLQWQASENASSYHVQVSTSPDFSSLTVNQSGVNEASLSLNNLANTTTYHWRVRAVNQTGESAWSGSWRFTTEEINIPANSLVGHWQLDEGSGNRFLDNSGNGNHATLVTAHSVKWIQGIQGLAVDMPGTTGRFANAPSNPSLNISDAITIAVWVRPNTTKNKTIISKVNNNGFMLGVTGSAKALFWFNSDSHQKQYRFESNGTLPNDGKTWVHIAATYDGRVVKMYINGKEDRSVSFPLEVKIGTNNSNLVIGALESFERWYGGIDDLRLYNKVLNGTEVADLASVGSSQFSLNANAQTQQIGILETNVVDNDAGLDKVKNLLIYPNPLTSQAKLKYFIPDKGEYSILLYDSKGTSQVIMKSGVAQEGEVGELIIDGSKLSKGLYFIRLQTTQRSNLAVKLIVQK